LSVTSADADRLGLGLSKDIGEHEQRHGKGETDFQGADHDRLASSLMRWLMEGWGRKFRNATPKLRLSFRNAAATPPWTIGVMVFRPPGSYLERHEHA
jgi:hypothetical protein